MAGDWLKVQCTTPDKPEVCALASMLKIDQDAAFGKVFRVWAWFDSHTENGNAPSVSKMLLDRFVFVPGFCDAMISVGWMLEREGSIALPNFDRHNGNTAKNRALTSKRVAKHKEKTNDPVTLGALEKRYLEKRREEKSISKKKNTHAEIPEHIEVGEQGLSGYSLPVQWDNPKIHAAVKAWASYYPTAREGRVFDQIQAALLVYSKMSAGWTQEDFCQSIYESIPEGYKTVTHFREVLESKARRNGEGGKTQKPKDSLATYSEIKPQRKAVD